MKHNWTYKKLGELVNIHDTLRKPVTKKDRKAGVYPYYGATGIQDYVDNYIFDGRYVLVGEDGAKWGANEKSAYIIEGKSWVNNHAHVLSFTSDVCDSFVAYYLNYKDLDSFISGAIVRKLTQKSLLSIPLPIPSLDEQQAIVRELDGINRLIDLQEEQLREYDRLAQSLFYTTFGDPATNPKGWEVKKLGEIATVKIGPFGSLLHTSDYINGGVPLVNPIHMKNGYIVADDNFTISEPKAEELRSYRMSSGDFVFARRGDIGRCAIVTEKEDGFLCGTGSLFVRFNGSVVPIYALFWTKCESFIKELTSQAKGATMLNINCGIVENLRIPLPPLALQQSFAAQIEAIEQQKTLIRRSLDETRTLLAARMQYYFE